MAPKRRLDAVVKEIPKTYTFGRSLIDGADENSLQKKPHDRDRESPWPRDYAEAPR
jgi:hypothetical protein